MDGKLALGRPLAIRYVNEKLLYKNDLQDQQPRTSRPTPSSSRGGGYGGGRGGASGGPYHGGGGRGRGRGSAMGRQESPIPQVISEKLPSHVSTETKIRALQNKLRHMDAEMGRQLYSVTTTTSTTTDVGRGGSSNSSGSSAGNSGSQKESSNK
eukprot:GEZU01003325.1.p1 GENE.GEZU01003325.1~~GEZU01003325.1.p1  ORF type:complete len:154 (-),score=14.02 GEZU01003325.1:25-486(-)